MAFNNYSGYIENNRINQNPSSYNNPEDYIRYAKLAREKPVFDSQVNNRAHQEIINTYNKYGNLTYGQIQDAYSQYGNQPITSQTLTSATPYTIPETTPSTTAEGALAEVASQGKSAAQLNLDNFNRELDAYKTEQTSKTSEQEGKVRGIFNSILGIKGQQSQLEEKAGIPKLNTEIAGINARIESAEGARIAEIAALEGQNMTATGSLSAQAGINRKYAIQQLAEGIMLNAKTRNLTALQGNIDRKIQLELEPLQLQYQFESKFLERNYDNLDKADRQLFEAKASETKRLLDNADKTLTEIGNFAKQVAANGAPAEVISAVANAKTVAAAAQAAGQYAGDYLKRQKDLLEIVKLNKEIKALDGPQITNPEAAKYAGALGVILGSEKFTKEQRNAVINAVNTGQDPISVIKNQAKNVMGQTTATELGKYETARAQLDSINTLLSQFYTNGGNTGIFAGNYEKAINGLGTVSDPKLVSIATNIAAALQIYRNAVSGTAYSVQEGKDIASIFPGINKSQGLNEAIISGRRQAFDVSIDQGYRNVLGTTYDELKKAQNVQITTDDPLGLGILKPENLQSNPLGI